MTTDPTAAPVGDWIACRFCSERFTGSYGTALAKATEHRVTTHADTLDLESAIREIRGVLAENARLRRELGEVSRLERACHDAGAETWIAEDRYRRLAEDVGKLADDRAAQAARLGPPTDKTSGPDRVAWLLCDEDATRLRAALAATAPQTAPADPHGCDERCAKAAEHGLHPPAQPEEHHGNPAVVELRNLRVGLAERDIEAPTFRDAVPATFAEIDRLRAALATAERERDEARRLVKTLDLMLDDTVGRWPGERTAAAMDRLSRQYGKALAELKQLRPLRAEVQRTDKLLSNLRDDVLADTVGISAISGRINLIRDELRRAALGSTPTEEATDAA